MNCKEICSKHLAKKPGTKKTGRYELGQKRCSVCEVYIIWDGRNCPCCGSTLRKKPRYAKGRDKIVKTSK